MNTDKTVEILLVEDSDLDAELALRALTQSNISNKIIRLNNGEEAMDFVFGEGAYKGRSIYNQPRVILLDLKMPKVDGLEVLKRIRSTEATKLIPVVMLTSSQEERDLIESYQLGVNSFIVKPVEFESFSKAIRVIGFYWIILNQKP